MSFPKVTIEEAERALSFIDSSSLSYKQWLDVYMACQREGLPVYVVENWSAKDADRFKIGEAEKKFRSFNPNRSNPVTWGTVVKMAKEGGYIPPRRKKASKHASASVEMPSAIIETLPLPAEPYNAVMDAAAYLTALYEPGEYVAYTTRCMWDDARSKWKPTGGNYGRTCAELIRSLEKFPNDITDTFGSYNKKAGVWACINPCDGKGRSNDKGNIVDFRFTLIECDSISIDEQFRKYQELQLPIKTLVHSGGKSLHAAVHIGAKSLAEYDSRVRFLYEYCIKHGLPLDDANKNCSRLSRIPGFDRGDNKQYLVGTDIGLPDFDSWKAWADSNTDPVEAGGQPFDASQFSETDFSTEAPYKALFALDTFEREKHLIALQNQARAVGFGVKNFNSMWKAYLRRRRQIELNPICNVTEFTGQPLIISIGEWEADDTGVHLINDRTGADEYACPHPIMPVRRMRDMMTGVEGIEIAFMTASEWETMKVDREIISSQQKIIGPLSNRGIGVNTGNSALLVKYFADALNFSKDAIPVCPSVSRCGFLNSKFDHFAPYLEGVAFGGDSTNKALFESISSRGDYETWKEQARVIREYSKIAKIAMAASFASTLTPIFGMLPYFVHIWSAESGTGKTVLLMAVASVWGNPVLGKYIQTFEATSVGLERYAAFLNNLPGVIDELQIAVKDNGADRRQSVLYRLAEGIGRTRGNRNGGIDTTTTWSNCFITSGETPITSTSVGAGAMNRAFEMECKPGQMVIEDGVTTSAILRENYGHAGKDFIEHLIGNVDSVKAFYLETLKAITSDTDSTEKQAIIAAAILAADHFASEWIFQDDALTFEDINPFLKTKIEVDVNERAYAFLVDYIAQNAFRFNQEAVPYTDSSTKEEKTTDQAAANECIGILKHFEGLAYITRSAFDSILNQQGFNGQAFVSWLKKTGKLVTQSSSRGNTVNMRINNVQTSCMCIKLPEE